MNPKAYADVIFTIGTAGDERAETDAWTHANAEGVVNESFTLLAPDEPITWRSLRVISYDALSTRLHDDLQLRKLWFIPLFRQFQGEIFLPGAGRSEIP